MATGAPMRFRSGGILLAYIVSAAAAGAESRFDADLLKALEFRNLGPFRAGSWVTDFAVPDSPAQAHLYTFYVATRNGGVWKTTNNGTTFQPIFDEQPVLSIGDVAVAPSNPDVVWVGTGEAYCARSSNRGDGVYKSTDGGKTWRNMGLRDSHHVARIVIHPSNPDIVYVAAMGHLFTTNVERGVFKTVDGGETWQKCLDINEKVGVIDLVMDDSNPGVLYAAAYEKERLPWHFEEGGPESAVYRTFDGGQTWSRLKSGLPTGKIGRIGLDLCQKNPSIVYAFVENANKRPPTDEEAAQDRKDGREPQERIIGGEVYRSDDAGRTWKRTNTGQEALGTKAPYSFNQIRVDPSDDMKIYVTGVYLSSSTDGGKTWRDVGDEPTELFTKAFGDVRTLWIDPQNSNRMLFGSDGGVHVTYDGGETCDHVYNIPLGEFYAAGVDMADPYNIYGGLQDHDSWKGPSNGWSGEVTMDDWVTVGVEDGMYNQVDHHDSRWVYNTFQFGGHSRVDQKLGTRRDIKPRRGEGKEPYRFNWTPPLHISPHNSSVIYTGAEVLLRSTDRGDHWEEISPHLTTGDKAKIAAGGPAITFCTITTICESPVAAGVIWAGTDDGKVQVTRDAGKTWNDCTGRIAAAGGPEDRWVSRVFASPHHAGAAFVSKTGFRQDDATPYLFRTTDYGQTWQSIAGDLPEKPVNVVIQDRKNSDLLFAGTDHGLYASIDAGASWLGVKSNLPWVKVTDLLIHPRENDLVVATYGRGLFVADITPLQELTPAILDEEAHLFEIEPMAQRATRGWGSYAWLGDRHLSTPNEPDAIVINYHLREKSSAKAKVTVADSKGAVLVELEGPAEEGINKVLWDMRPAKPSDADAPATATSVGPVEPGEYAVTLEVAGKKLARKALIRGRTGWSIGPHPVALPEDPIPR
ncbi:MAG: hypothetical protein AB1714_02795 [Acidobacteriota bacterium]